MIFLWAFHALLFNGFLIHAFEPEVQNNLDYGLYAQHNPYNGVNMMDEPYNGDNMNENATQYNDNYSPKINGANFKVMEKSRSESPVYLNGANRTVKDTTNYSRSWKDVFSLGKDKDVHVIRLRLVVTNFNKETFRASLARKLGIDPIKIKNRQILKKRIITVEIVTDHKTTWAITQFLLPLRLSQKPVKLDRTVYIIFARILERPSTAWGYTWLSGLSPKSWEKKYPTCGHSLQSPIDIDTTQVEIRQSDSSFTALYVSSPSVTMATLRNAGSGIVLDLNEDVVRLMGGPLEGMYVLETVEFHWNNQPGFGSEHTLDGIHGKLEAQFVFYQAAYGDVMSATEHNGIAILSVLYEVGPPNAELEKIIRILPGVLHPDYEEAIDTPLVIEQLYGGSSRLNPFYTYDGSKTSPPCSEGVKWLVTSKIGHLSGHQLEQFKSVHLYHESADQATNCRPTQELHGRTVTKFVTMYGWWEGDWSRCARNVYGVCEQVRKVICRDAQKRQVSDKLCSAPAKTVAMRECKGFVCDNTWDYQNNINTHGVKRDEQHDLANNVYNDYRNYNNVHNKGSRDKQNNDNNYNNDYRNYNNVHNKGSKYKQYNVNDKYRNNINNRNFIAKDNHHATSTATINDKNGERNKNYHHIDDNSNFVTDSPDNTITNDLSPISYLGKLMNNNKNNDVNDDDDDDDDDDSNDDGNDDGNDDDDDDGNDDGNDDSNDDDDDDGNVEDDGNDDGNDNDNEDDDNDNNGYDDDGYGDDDNNEDDNNEDDNDDGYDDED